jgi:hypothetical protein
MLPGAALARMTAQMGYDVSRQSDQSILRFESQYFAPVHLGGLRAWKY